MNVIKEKLDKIYDKYGEYLHFDYTKQKIKGKTTERWTVYMSAINHNTFDSRDRFLNFLDKLIETDIACILRYRLNEKREELKDNLDYVDDLKDEIKELEKNINNQ